MSAPAHSPLACGWSAAWRHAPLVPYCGPNAAAFTGSKCLSARQASSPRVPPRSSLSRSLAIVRLSGPIKMIEHHVDDHAGDGDVEPERERPAGNRAVAREVAAQSARERDEDERHDDNREHGVREQDTEVQRTYPALPLKTHRADLRVI